MTDDPMENAFINEAARMNVAALLSDSEYSGTPEQAAKLAYDFAEALNTERKRRRQLADKAPKKGGNT